MSVGIFNLRQFLKRKGNNLKEFKNRLRSNLNLTKGVKVLRSKFLILRGGRTVLFISVLLIGGRIVKALQFSEIVEVAQNQVEESSGSLAPISGGKTLKEIVKTGLILWSHKPLHRKIVQVTKTLCCGVAFVTGVANGFLGLESGWISAALNTCCGTFTLAFTGLEVYDKLSRGQPPQKGEVVDKVTQAAFDKVCDLTD